MKKPTTISKESVSEYREFVQLRLRKRVLEAIEVVLEEEVDQALGCRSYERAEDRRGYRNGAETRRVTTSVGTRELRVPRARVRDEETGETTEFRSELQGVLSREYNRRPWPLARFPNGHHRSGALLSSTRGDSESGRAAESCLGLRPDALLANRGRARVRTPAEDRAQAPQSRVHRDGPSTRIQVSGLTLGIAANQERWMTLQIPACAKTRPFRNRR